MKYLFILLLALGFSQTEVSQRVIDLTVESGEVLDLDYLFPDYSLNWGIINIISCPTGECFIEQIGGHANNSVHKLRSSNYQVNGIYYYPAQNVSSSFYISSLDSFIIGFGISGVNTMKLLITAEFPEEDTGYIEEGFEFCVSPGANLLSFPCDNPISVSASLPQGSENFITSIIGQGVATEYNSSLGWIGSLAEFTPGSGYWFKSNESLCFEYECVAN